MVNCKKIIIFFYLKSCKIRTRLDYIESTLIKRLPDKGRGRPWGSKGQNSLSKYERKNRGDGVVVWKGKEILDNVLEVKRLGIDFTKK